MMLRSLGFVAALGLTLTGCDETMMAPGGGNHTVRVSNQSGRTVYELYASSTYSQYWEEDHLGAQVLPSGSALLLDFSADGQGCIYDFYVVFADGDSFEDYDVNICTASTYTIR